MIGDSRYLLDANVFIEAAKGYYAFDIAPRFWEALIANATNRRVISIDRVNAELNRGNDDLKEWANGSFHHWFESTDADGVIKAYGRIMAWAAGQTQYSDAAKAEFARSVNADAWVVAYALARGCIVVTHEQLNPQIRRRIPIPNVCRAFNVEYIDTFQLLRTLGVRLG